jgi:hypothetical protein
LLGGSLIAFDDVRRNRFPQPLLHQNAASYPVEPCNPFDIT